MHLANWRILPSRTWLKPSYGNNMPCRTYRPSSSLQHGVFNPAEEGPIAGSSLGMLYEQPGVWACTRSWDRRRKRLERPDLVRWSGKRSTHSCLSGGLGELTIHSVCPIAHPRLGWFSFDGFLSLGFGRPQSTQFETVDEQGFLQIRLNQPIPRPGTTQSLSLYGDVYIAGQVQLTQIGRDLVNWGEMLADPERAVQADPRRAEMLKDREMRVLSMFRELNGRLDEWCKLWVWSGGSDSVQNAISVPLFRFSWVSRLTSGSPYTLYLGSSARIARLQAEHMRLCLNSFALKSSPEQDDLIASFLKKALNAAMSTIQTHFESSQTDLALSFATDVSIPLFPVYAFTHEATLHRSDISTSPSPSPKQPSSSSASLTSHPPYKRPSTSNPPSSRTTSRSRSIC